MKKNLDALMESATTATQNRTPATATLQDLFTDPESVPSTGTPPPEAGTPSQEVKSHEKGQWPNPHGRPSAVGADTLPEGFQASQPLANKKLERFCQLLTQGAAKWSAYKRAFQSKANMKSCSSSACKVSKRLDVLARLEYLKGDRQEEDEARGVMTRAEKLRFLERVIRSGSPADKIRALSEHNKLTGETGPEEQKQGNRLPDPTQLAEYFRRAEIQGADPVELAEKQADKQESAPDPGENSIFDPS